jgi:triosephosphate isomerase (TIM)
MMTEPHSIRPLVAGNWKMNGLKKALDEAMTVAETTAAKTNPVADVMICPPATLLMVLAEVTREMPFEVGAQDCHWLPSGAHTGDISAEMVKDAGGAAVILGHSERRSDHGELDRHVRAKAEAAHGAGLGAIICVGETAGERACGITLDVVGRQLKGSVPDGATSTNTVVAYEPVWAIGTGLTPTAADVADVHSHIRAALEARFGSDGSAFRILYGGSVKPTNASELLHIPNVNGALVGGASLKAADFLGIIAALDAAPEPTGSAAPSAT